ncbi:hypothetical protein, partial [Chamaesiphon sp. VAR_69_metabat_338]|uniref:hypothetical protein n=1 Tax=Chamaesiphon sp. VAR_69_metabat_338 TaxID=2964704 RepID=UPI00286DCEE8
MLARWRSLVCRLSRKLQPDRDSAEYQTWRQQFLLDRLKIALWIAFPMTIALHASQLFVFFLDSQRFEQDILRFYGDTSL